MASNDKHAQLVTHMQDAEKDAQNGENLFLVQLVTAATQDKTPQYTLAEVHKGLLEAKAWSLLDPLNLLPLLVSSDKDAAPELIQTISQEASPKETVIAVQEALEYLERPLSSEMEDREDSDQKHSSELVQLLNVCQNSIPRLKLRKKGPAETLRPLLTHLGTAIHLVAPSAPRESARNIISSVSQLIKASLPWLSQNAEANGSEHKAAAELLTDLLFVTLSACAVNIHASLAQRRFEASNPRLVLRSAIDAHSERGLEAVQEALNVARTLGITSGSLASRPPSLGQLILISHEDPAFLPTSPTYLQKLLPVLTHSLQQNIGMDESLALLLTFLSSGSTRIISEELVDPIAALLTPLASTHPHPPTRHVAFRILGLLLSRASPPVHLAHMSSLLTDCPFPQMRVAAVGLVKEAFLNAINSGEKSPYTSPTLVRALGPTLFRPDPVDLFTSPSDESLSKFLECSEPARLTECLAFYYVLLKRDTHNLSGIRDRDMLRTVENGLLAPLRRALAVWLEGSSSFEDTRALMPLASLETSLERVDGVVASLLSP